MSAVQRASSTDIYPNRFLEVDSILCCLPSPKWKCSIKTNFCNHLPVYWNCKNWIHNSFVSHHYRFKVDFGKSDLEHPVFCCNYDLSHLWDGNCTLSFLLVTVKKLFHLSIKLKMMPVGVVLYLTQKLLYRVWCTKNCSNNLPFYNHNVTILISNNIERSF